MTAASVGNTIRINDLNQPVFRTYSKKRILPIFVTHEDALRNPATWDDPFEDFLLKRTKVEVAAGQFADLESLSNDRYGQCWTTNSDTDAMWRIYSAGKEGIQARTTIRKLFDNLRQTVSVNADLQCFVGRVEYLTLSDITALMADLTFAQIAIGGDASKFANLLCIKREAFSHEAEVRILFQELADSGRGSNGTFLYALDPNSVFEELVLDPRLEDSAALALKTELEESGCRIPVRRSELYHAPQFIIPIQ